jgi:hypothetical protein
MFVVTVRNGKSSSLSQLHDVGTLAPIAAIDSGLMLVAAVITCNASSFSQLDD